MKAFHRRRLLSRPRVCIFCGRPPTGKSREHIIPRWLIEQTGDPRRIILLWPFTSQSVIKGRSDPFKSFSFDSFTFPSCRSCNSTFASLEGRAKPLLQALFAAQALSASDFDTILDWFDKVRVGLWLAFHYFLDRNYWGVQPHFFISDRIGQADRCLVVSRSRDYQPGIRFAGVNTPAFAHTPSCFSLAVDGWVLLNISYQLLLSKAAGLPYPSSLLLNADERLQMELEPGKGNLEYPLLPFTTPPQGILIGQPIIPRVHDPISVEDLYRSEYVARMAPGGRGRILIGRSGTVSVYPDLPVLDWCPPPRAAFLEGLARNAEETLIVQNDLVRMVTLSPSMPPEQRQFMETQNANCIRANDQFLDLVRRGSV
jgi:hypothetical protein